MKKILNPFINIRLNGKYGFLIVDNFNKKTFKLSKIIIKEIFNGSKNNNEFVKNGLLVDQKSNEMLLYESSKFWREYNCYEALMYHAEAYLFPFLDYEDESSYKIDYERMAKYAKKDNFPSFFKLYNGEKILFNMPTKYPVVDTQSVMKCEVNKNTSSPSKQTLEIFAYCCFGDTLQDVKENRFIKKTIPSGGAKHPTEAYFVFPSNSFFPAGVYHYNVKENGFDIISNCDKWSIFHEASYFTHPKNANNRFGIVYTSMVERAMYRYRDIRSTRAILADVGHAIQNSKLVGLALGLLSVTEYKVQDKKLKELLGIDKNSEIVIATQSYFTDYE